MPKGMKWHMLVTATAFNYQNLPGKDKKILGTAIARNEAYLAGFCKPPSHYTLSNWYEKYSKAKGTSVRIDSLFDSKSGQNRIKYVTYIEKQFPQFLHQLYRYATKTLGVDANVPMLVNMMNAKSRIDHPFCPVRSVLRMSKAHFWTFFNLHGGKLKNPVTKPSLTEQHKKDRLIFCKRNLRRAIEHDKNDNEKYKNKKVLVMLHGREVDVHFIPPQENENLTCCTI